MALDLGRWRELVDKERRLLSELALILVATLVVGVYFLENVDTTSSAQQRQAAEAMAEQLAHGAAEYVVTANLVSLNVVASHAASLDTVARVEFRSATDGVLARAGGSAASDDARGMPVERAIRLEDGSVAGAVRLWPALSGQPLSARLENGFVLIVLCLMVLRVLAEAVRRRWLMLRQTDTEDDEDPEDMEADILPVLTMSAAGQGAHAWLRLSIVNFDRMKERLTATLQEEILVGYQRRLEQVAAIYGAELVAPLGECASLKFSAEKRAEACFQALCAGMLFRRLARELSDQRKNRDRTPLEFKQLVSGMGNHDTSWALCLAGLPGRVHVPEQELMALELDTRLLFQPERCLVVSADDHEVRLQPVEQLAQRYQRLVSEQARRLTDAA